MQKVGAVSAEGSRMIGNNSVGRWPAYPSDDLEVAPLGSTAVLVEDGKSTARLAERRRKIEPERRWVSSAGYERGLDGVDSVLDRMIGC